MQMRKIKFLLNVTLILLSLKNVSAQTNQDETKNDSKVIYTTGVGIGLVPQYEGSDEVLLLPALTFSANWNSGQYIRFAGLGIEANILSKGKWEFGPKIGFKLPRNDSFIDNENITALEESDFSLFAGLFTRYKFGNGFDAQISYIHDISAVSEGGLANLELGYTLRVKRFIHRISVNGSCATKNYMNTYFSVNTENVGTSSLPMYDLDGGIKDIGISLSSIYVITKKWGVIGRLGYKSLTGDVADSPIVMTGSSNQFSGGVILTYNFLKNENK